MSHLIDFALSASGVFGFSAIWLMPSVTSMRGRIISAFIVRLMGLVYANLLRISIMVIWMVSLIVWDEQGSPNGVLVDSAFMKLVMVVWNLWLIDDWLNDRDNHRKRNRVFESLKVKLKKHKRVRLRPAERWVPVGP